MTSVAFIKNAAAASGMSQKAIREVLNAIEPTIIEMAKNGEKFHVAGFIVEGGEVGETTRRNPATGESFTAPAHRTIKVRVPKTVKDAVK